MPENAPPLPTALATRIARTALLTSICAVGALLSLGGCGTVAQGGLPGPFGTDLQQGAQVVHYRHDAEFVWARVKETLAHLSSRQPEFDDEEFRAFATVDEGSIQIGVLPGDTGTCRMAVKARKYGVQSDELAESVLERIHREVDR